MVVTLEDNRALRGISPQEDGLKHAAGQAPRAGAPPPNPRKRPSLSQCALSALVGLGLTVRDVRASVY